MDGEEEDADEEDGDFDEDFGEEEDDGFYDSEAEEFEEDVESVHRSGAPEHDDPNREPTAKEKAAQLLETNRAQYPVYRGILTEVNLISSFRLIEIVCESSTHMSNFLKVSDFLKQADERTTQYLKMS